MLILNEEKYAKDLYNGKNQNVKSIMSKIRYVVRYFVHSEQKSNNEAYNKTVAWLKQNHHNFDESSYSNVISDAIKAASKYPFYIIDNIKITRSELEIISSLDNLRAEKILFVLLCMAKQQSMANGFTNGLVKYSITDLCKAARVSVPADDREYILYEIVQRGLLGYPKKNNTQCLIVNFIDNCGDDVLILNETDCQELAYVYLNWKNKGVGYSRCEFCGRLMKQSKKNQNRFCESCSSMIGDIDDDTKVVSCVDCGKPVYVSVFDSKTVRCEECQSKADSKSNRERQQRWYDTHIKPNGNPQNLNTTK